MIAPLSILAPPSATCAAQTAAQTYLAFVRHREILVSVT